MPQTHNNMIDGTEYTSEGTFPNGDHWTGYQHKEDGKWWYEAVDKDGRPYETAEEPRRFPLLTLTQFVGSWTAAEVNASLAARNGQEPR